MDTDIELSNYLQDKLGSTCYYKLLHFVHGDISILTQISMQKLPNNILCAIKEFFKNLSIERTSEYINKTNSRGENILFYCVDIELMKVVIEYVDDINLCCSTSTNTNNALMATCQRNIGFGPVDIEIVELLLDSGIDINATNKYGYTALMLYCARYSSLSSCFDENFERLVELLIRRGADILIKSNDGLQAYDLMHKSNTILLSVELSQLLQGEISMRYTKNAANV